MLDSHIKKLPKKYDAFIVGPGAVNGMTAHIVTKARLKLRFIEVVRMSDRAVSSTQINHRPGKQIFTRIGLIMLNGFRLKTYQSFTCASKEQRTAVVDLIAFPVKAKPVLSQARKFFIQLRTCAVTGFHASVYLYQQMFAFLKYIFHHCPASHAAAGQSAAL